MQNSESLEEIYKIQEEYYNKNNKNMFFKKSQKTDCANQVCEKFDLVYLINMTINIVQNTNIVFFDYLFFKTYATPQNYEQVVLSILEAVEECILKYGSFEFHINLKSFTISAAERYRKVIELFCDKCLNQTNNYSEYLSQLVVYNTPNIMDSIYLLFKQFINPVVNDKIKLLDKDESQNKLNELLGGGYTI
jgi:hypothetical protein